MQVNPSVFKAYDIRGIVGSTIDEIFAEHLGRAFGSEAVRLGEKGIAVGRDGRRPEQLIGQVQQVVAPGPRRDDPLVPVVVEDRTDPVRRGRGPG